MNNSMDLIDDKKKLDLNRTHDPFQQGDQSTLQSEGTSYVQTDNQKITARSQHNKSRSDLVDNDEDLDDIVNAFLQQRKKEDEEKSKLLKAKMAAITTFDHKTPKAQDDDQRTISTIKHDLLDLPKVHHDRNKKRIKKI